MALSVNRENLHLAAALLLLLAACGKKEQPPPSKTEPTALSVSTEVITALPLTDPDLPRPKVFNTSEKQAFWNKLDRASKQSFLEGAARVPASAAREVWVRQNYILWYSQKFGQFAKVDFGPKNGEHNPWRIDGSITLLT